MSHSCKVVHLLFKLFTVYSWSDEYETVKVLVKGFENISFKLNSSSLPAAFTNAFTNAFTHAFTHAFTFFFFKLSWWEKS